MYPGNTEKHDKTFCQKIKKKNRGENLKEQQLNGFDNLNNSLNKFT